MSSQSFQLNFNKLLFTLFGLILLFSSWSTAQCTSNSKITVRFEAPSTATLTETAVSVKVYAEPFSNAFTFNGKSTPTVDIYFGRPTDCFSSTCSGANCYVKYNTYTMAQVGSADKYSYTFTYNQSSYNRATSADQQLGYNFSIKAVVNCDGGSSCAAQTISVKKLYAYAKVSSPVALPTPCYATSASLPTKFELSDPYRYSNTTHVLTITGPSYSQTFNIPVTSFNASGGYTQTIPVITVKGTYNWTLVTRINDDETSAGITAAQGKFYYMSSTAECDCMKNVYALFPGEIGEFVTDITPSYKTAIMQTKAGITFIDRAHASGTTVCSDGKIYYKTRTDHKYYLSLGSNQVGPFSSATMDSKLIVPFTASTTLGTYTFTYWATYVEDMQDQLGARPACDPYKGFPKTLTKQWKTYPVYVTKIKVLTGKSVVPVAAATIQDAFTKCNAENGGDIWVLDSYTSSSTDNVVTVGNFCINLNVRSPTGYKLNGKVVNQYFNGDMSTSKISSQFGYNWYSVTINPMFYPKTATLSGDLASWPKNLNATQQVDVSSATIGTGVAKNIGAGNVVNITGNTTVQGSVVNIKTDPTIK